MHLIRASLCYLKSVQPCCRPMNIECHDRAERADKQSQLPKAFLIESLESRANLIVISRRLDRHSLQFSIQIAKGHLHNVINNRLASNAHEHILICATNILRWKYKYPQSLSLLARLQHISHCQQRVLTGNSRSTNFTRFVSSNPLAYLTRKQVAHTVAQTFVFGMQSQTDSGSPESTKEKKKLNFVVEDKH